MKLNITATAKKNTTAPKDFTDVPEYVKAEQKLESLRQTARQLEGEICDTQRRLAEQRLGIAEDAVTRLLNDGDINMDESLVTMEHRHDLNMELHAKEAKLHIVRAAIREQEDRMNHQRRTISRDICAGAKPKHDAACRQMALTLIEFLKATGTEWEIIEDLRRKDVSLYQELLPIVTFPGFSTRPDGGLEVQHPHSLTAQFLRMATERGWIERPEIPVEWQQAWVNW